MAKDCPICQTVRWIAVGLAPLCFTVLAWLTSVNGSAVPLWVIAGFWVSVVVAFWAVASYLRSRLSVS